MLGKAQIDVTIYKVLNDLLNKLNIFVDNIEHEENFCHKFLINIQLINQFYSLKLDEMIMTLNDREIFQLIEFFHHDFFAKLIKKNSVKKYLKQKK